jgi:hypothetical protein
MPNFLIAVAILVGGYWLIRKMARTPQASMQGFLQKLGGGAIIAASGLLALRGQMNIAVPLFLFGIGLIGKGAAFPNGFTWNKKSAGQKSRVATSQLAMELDHDSGAMDGEVLAGPFKGRKLSSMAMDELKQLHRQCCSVNDQSAALMEAWLDRTQGEWRATWGAGPKGAATGGGVMSREEALSILGLKTGATPEQIRAAHKRLMKDFHPDRGGSDYLAAKINAAKDLLLAES